MGMHCYARVYLVNVFCHEWNKMSAEFKNEDVTPGFIWSLVHNGNLLHRSGHHPEPCLGGRLTKTGLSRFCCHKIQKKWNKCGESLPHIKTVVTQNQTLISVTPRCLDVELTITQPFTNGLYVQRVRVSLIMKSSHAEWSRIPLGPTSHRVSYHKLCNRPWWPQAGDKEDQRT